MKEAVSGAHGRVQGLQPELARKVSLDELKEDVDSLLETIGEELSKEELDELEKQRRQLEEEVEAEQHPMAHHRRQSS